MLLPVPPPLAPVSAGAACRSLPLASEIPCCPFETMLFERIESPVPDWTRTPAWTLNAMMFPWPPPVPPIVLLEALLLRMMPLTSFPSAQSPLKSVPTSFPSITLLVAVEPSIRIPQWLLEITLRAAEVVPPIVLPDAPSIRIPSCELPRSARARHVGTDQVALDQILGGRLAVDLDSYQVA